MHTDGLALMSQRVKLHDYRFLSEEGMRQKLEF